MRRDPKERFERKIVWGFLLDLIALVILLCMQGIRFPLFGIWWFVSIIGCSTIAATTFHIALKGIPDTLEPFSFHLGAICILALAGDAVVVIKTVVSLVIRALHAL